MRKSYARGIGFLATEIAFIWYMVAFGAGYLKDFGTLGTKEGGFDENYVYTYGDNSFFILLYSLLSLFLIFFFVYLWRANLRDNKFAEEKIAAGRKVPTAMEDLKSLLDENFHKTLLALPLLGVFVFWVLPIAFMICVAFTNYDYNHQAPTNLFTWVGFENFKALFSFGEAGFGSTFMSVLGWTLVWAFFATFLNYFLGMGVAILINKKGVKLKKLWRTILVMTIAIPQFVSLLYVCSLVMNAIIKRGYSVPADVKIASFYSSSLIENFGIGITSPHFDENKLGMIVCDTLISLIEGNYSGHHTKMEYDLVIKESTKGSI